MNYRAILLAVAGLVALGSCTKDEPVPVKPYYQFTTADQAWLLPAPDQEWVFENAQGRQRHYRLRETTQLKLNYSTGQFGLFAPTIHYYYDSREIVFARVDSADLLRLRVERNLPAGVDPTTPPPAGSVLRVNVAGSDLLGTNPDDLMASGFGFRPDEVRAGAEQVRGQQYDAVVRLESGSPVCRVCAAPRRIQRVLYDRQYGIVRLESVTGEVWDRVR